MKLFAFLIIGSFLFFIACDKETIVKEPVVNPIELRNNFSEAEFKQAIIGEWKSVFENTGEENVISLSLTDKNNATITISKEGSEKTYNGTYSVSFLSPSSPERITFGEITIKTTSTDIVLSRVNFGLHSAVRGGPFLRIDVAPHGVLERK
jgi:uncharacterized membrane protein